MTTEKPTHGVFPSGTRALVYATPGTHGDWIVAEEFPEKPERTRFAVSYLSADHVFCGFIGWARTKEDAIARADQRAKTDKEYGEDHGH